MMLIWNKERSVFGSHLFYNDSYVPLAHRGECFGDATNGVLKRSSSKLSSRSASRGPKSTPAIASANCRRISPSASTACPGIVGVSTEQPEAAQLLGVPPLVLGVEVHRGRPVVVVGRRGEGASHAACCAAPSDDAPAVAVAAAGSALSSSSG